MEKKSVLIIAIVLIVVLSSILLYRNRALLGSFLGLEGMYVMNSVPIDINYGNIGPMLSENNIVNDLPKDSAVLLIFYNLDSGSREWEKSYVITKGHVEEGYREDADVTIFLHSKYLTTLTDVNYCSVFQEAVRNNDLSLDSELSGLKLLWKFRSMLKYRNCLGF